MFMGLDKNKNFDAEGLHPMWSCHEPSSIGYIFLTPPTAMGGANEFQHFSPATN